MVTLYMVQEEENIEAPSVGGREPRSVPRHILSEIIEARTREMFELLDNEISESGYREIISSGIVLTGGAASMQGMAELAEDVFQSPVRVGIPIGLGGLMDVVNNPMYATCTGLIQYGSKRFKSGTNRELQGRNLFRRSGVNQLRSTQRLSPSTRQLCETPSISVNTSSPTFFPSSFCPKGVS